jgi:hypothetical protein
MISPEHIPIPARAPAPPNLLTAAYPLSIITGVKYSNGCDEDEYAPTRQYRERAMLRTPIARWRGMDLGAAG